MPPCHILPLTAVRIILVVEVPHTILVKHSVGIVHPTIERGVVVDRTEVLAVRGVESVGILHLSPASKLTHSALLAAVSVEFDIQQASTLQFVRHIIVYAVNGQLHVEALHHIIMVV